MNLFEKRHSVRKFKEQDVSNDLIKKIIENASFAPSGKNKQNWHVVALKKQSDKDMIMQSLNEKIEKLEKISTSEELAKIKKMTPYLAWLTKAPVIFLIYASDYIPTGYEMFLETDVDSEELANLIATAPGIQNIGAFIENLLLSATENGLGGCWMTAPMFASKEITENLKIDLHSYELTAMIPMGYPLTDEIPQKSRREVSEILTFL
ncbi:MAG: nitroreductase family protein [Acidaminobacteraceae bacterium]